MTTYSASINATKSSSYTKILDEIITTHRLTDYAQQRFADADSVRVVIATQSGVSLCDYSDLLTPGQTSAPSRRVTNFADVGAIYAITAIPCNPCPRYAYVTGRGRMIIADALGNEQKSLNISSASVWHVTCARLRNHWFLFVCSGDSLYVFDTAGELLCAIDMPGPMLSIDAAEIDGRVWLAGGANSGNGDVYVWDVDAMIRARDATPCRVLRSGKKPAFATCLYENAGAPWVAHGSWDGCVYLYARNNSAGSNPSPATLTLRAPAPVYPITTVNQDGRRWLLAGCEDGSISVWDMTMLRHGKYPDIRIANLRSRVKCMRYAEVGNRPILFAGCEGGGLYVFDLSALAQPTLLATIVPGNDEVCGVALLGMDL